MNIEKYFAVCYRCPESKWSISANNKCLILTDPQGNKRFDCVWSFIQKEGKKRFGLDFNIHSPNFSLMMNFSEILQIMKAQEKNFYKPSKKVIGE